MTRTLGLLQHPISLAFGSLGLSDISHPLWTQANHHLSLHGDNLTSNDPLSMLIIIVLFGVFTASVLCVPAPPFRRRILEVTSSTDLIV